MSTGGEGQAACWHRRSPARRRAGIRIRGAALLALLGAGRGAAQAAQAAQGTPGTPAAPGAGAAASVLVFDRVTVVDVEHGRLRPDQRVVIAGNRIQAVGDVGAIAVPKGARVVDAREKYLIPGLWDMHVHTTADLPYPLLIANGVTGIRDAWSYVPLDTMLQWQREILAGTRVGPPRQLLTGDLASLNELAQTDIAARKAQGANLIKLYPFDAAAAGAARQVGIRFGGHVSGISAAEASDSGISIIDHLITSGGLDTLCSGGERSVERCQPVADKFRHNGTWLAPTLLVAAERGGGASLTERAQRVFEDFAEHVKEFWDGKALGARWLREPVPAGTAFVRDADSLLDLELMQRVDLPMLAGTDMDVGPDHMWASPPGFALHAELAMEVSEGLTPWHALQAATLNPAKMFQATDSLGTVAQGKLADLVLLDGDPLAEITNTMAIRAVVSNGRYFDRAALDQLLTDVQLRAKQGFKYWWKDGERPPMKTGESP